MKYFFFNVLLFMVAVNYFVIYGQDSSIFNTWWGIDCSKSMVFFEKDGVQYTLNNKQSANDKDYWVLGGIGKLEINLDSYKGFRWYEQMGSTNEFIHYKYSTDGAKLTLTWVDSFYKDEYDVKTPTHPSPKTYDMQACRADFDVVKIREIYNKLNSQMISLQPSNLDKFIFNEDVKRIRDFMKQAESSCSEKSKIECIDYIWTFIDVTKDSKLSLAEVVRFMKFIAKGTFSQENPTSNKKSVFVVGSILSTPLIAKAYISNYDYDNDGLLTKNEILLDTELAEFKSLKPSSELSESIEKLINKATKAIPSFKND